MLALSFGLTQACSALLPWDGYTGTDEIPDATIALETGPLPDAARDVQPPIEAGDAAADAPVEGALAAFEVPCGPGLVCKKSKVCCAYGDGRPWECKNSCPTVDDGGAVLHCDSPTDCTPGAECCSELTEAGTLDQTFCSAICKGPLLTACDPAYGSRDCPAGSSCKRVLDAGYELTFCARN